MQAYLRATPVVNRAANRAARRTLGPIVVEIPPMVLGAVNDMQYRWVVDLGITGPDKGAPLDGDKNYKRHLPPNISARDFWSVILYGKSNPTGYGRFPAPAGTCSFALTARSIRGSTRPGGQVRSSCNLEFPTSSAGRPRVP